ncbi:MAG: hypothetical protein WC523_00625 [Patescibacteria group bacterium]
MLPTTLYDEWSWIAIDGMSTNTRRFSFGVQEEGEIVVEPETVEIPVCRPYPTWAQSVGLMLVDDVGNGMGLHLAWREALATSTTKQLYYNIYYSTTRFGVFSVGPKNLTTETEAVISVDPGKAYYLAVRAAEADTSDITISALEQVGENVYAYPTDQTLTDSIDAYGASVQVESTEGYPDTGVILVDYELMKYSSKDATTFYVAELDRAQSGTFASTHDIGASVSLWHGFEDGNSNIVQATADWFYTIGTPRNTDAIGQANVDEDGYRAALEDVLTTDLIGSETAAEDFASYDYCGYHRPSLQDSFSGECVGSYLGGDYNGSRGFNFQDRILSQLDSMLQVTGEYVVVLRRRWTGKRCRCISLRREHQRVRCPYCFATGFEGGFDRLFNSRPISETFVNTQGMFMMRTSPYVDDLDLVQDQGLRQPDEIVMWTLTVPNIKSRDIIIRYTEDGLEEFRYAVLEVTRNKLLFNKTGRQDIKMRRLDKTDPIYSYPTNYSPYFVTI